MPFDATELLMLMLKNNHCFQKSVLHEFSISISSRKYSGISATPILPRESTCAIEPPTTSIEPGELMLSKDGDGDINSLLMLICIVYQSICLENNQVI